MEKADVMGGGGRKREGRRGGRRTGGRSVCSQEGSAAAAAAAAGAGQWILSATAPNGHLDVSGTLEHKVRRTTRVLPPAAFKPFAVSFVREEKMQEGSAAAPRRSGSGRA